MNECKRKYKLVCNYFRDFELLHVYGHVGMLWNELADQVADQGSRGNTLEGDLTRNEETITANSEIEFAAGGLQSTLREIG